MALLRAGGAGISTSLFFFFLFDLNAEGLEELEILIVDLEFGIGGESGNKGSLVGSFFTLLADADGGFEDEKDVVTALFDAGDDFGDLFGVGKRLVDGLAEVLHELLELLVHLVPPDRRRPETLENIQMPAAAEWFREREQVCVIVAP